LEDCDGLELKLISPIIRIQFWLKLDRKKVITPKKLARFLYPTTNEQKEMETFLAGKKVYQTHSQNQTPTKFVSLNYSIRYSNFKAQINAERILGIS
jgi:hypothetical protein